MDVEGNKLKHSNIGSVIYDKPRYHTQHNEKLKAHFSYTECQRCQFSPLWLSGMCEVLARNLTKKKE